jgi:hypothetical protein
MWRLARLIVNSFVASFKSQCRRKVQKLAWLAWKIWRAQSGRQECGEIKSPECLGADLPKEHNLRAVPASSSSADCRLAATSPRRWKAQSVAKHKFPTARDTPFLFIRKVLMQLFVFGATRRLATHRHTCKMNTRARLTWNRKLWQGKESRRLIIPWQKRARIGIFKSVCRWCAPGNKLFSAITTAGEAHKKKTHRVHLREAAASLRIMHVPPSRNSQPLRFGGVASAKWESELPRRAANDAVVWGASWYHSPWAADAPRITTRALLPAAGKVRPRCSFCKSIAHVNKEEGALLHLQAASKNYLFVKCSWNDMRWKN